MSRLFAERRSQKFFRDQCRVYEKALQSDGMGGILPDDEHSQRTLYEGACFASPGNMWPFEAPIAGTRVGRSDIMFYFPRDVIDEGIGIESVVEYEGENYEVIGHVANFTAAAALQVTARRLTR